MLHFSCRCIIGTQRGALLYLISAWMASGTLLDKDNAMRRLHSCTAMSCAQSAKQHRYMP